MNNIDFLHTLFVGIDVSSHSNVVCALDFHSNKMLQFTVPNSRQGADQMSDILYQFLNQSDFLFLVVALESTSLYGVHIANHLSSDEQLMPFNPYVYCLNPKMIANYKKSFVGLSKNDFIDAFVIADFARVGRITISPWRGSQFLALQRLSRHRLHLITSLTTEKTYMASNIYLKFSQFAFSQNPQRPFSDTYGATASAVLTEFLSPEDILNTSIQDLVEFLRKNGKNRFPDPFKTAELLHNAANNSYRLDKCLYEPLTISIASSFNCIKTYEREIKSVSKAIEKVILGLNTNEYDSLRSIPGIGPVYAAGILAEIGSITTFSSHNALAKYAGLTWIENQSGDFKADDTHLSKAGNSYLRYYLIEAANSVKNHVPLYKAFYDKKYYEVKTHQHKRALALTSRKLVRLIFGLLANNRLYSDEAVDIHS